MRWFVVVASLVWVCACDGGGTAPESADTGDVAATPDVAAPKDMASTPDVPPPEDYHPGGAPLGEAGYTLEIKLSDGTTYNLDRDLSETPGAFSFGSTHIAPAVSFTVQDQILDPFMFVTLNFGFLVGSLEHETTIAGPGEYVLGGIVPAVKVELPPSSYQSDVTGSVGTLTITDYTNEPGGLFAGTVSATLVNKNKPEKYAVVNGAFSFVLPPKESGQ